VTSVEETGAQNDRIAVWWRRKEKSDKERARLGGGLGYLRHTVFWHEVREKGWIKEEKNGDTQ